MSGWRWVQAEVSVEEREDGCLILRNRIPLAPYPNNLATWLRDNAARFPDKPFLQQRDTGLAWGGVTYGQALAATNRISNGLLALELEPEAPIAILSENCVEMALLQLAAMQIGHPIVPISYAYSVRSHSGALIRHILETTKAPVLVISDANVHMPKLESSNLANVQLFAFSAAEAHANVRPFTSLYSGDGSLSAAGEARFTAVTADTPAKIQFTSGSTDLPKGVIITHGMMTSNQTGIAQTWPFLGRDEVIVDWLPWNHTFGGNFVFNMILLRGGTFYIDDGNPTPNGFEKTVRNIIDVSPTVYFGVPRSYTTLYERMKHDDALRQAFFQRLKFVFTAAAALDQSTYEGMKAMSREVRGAAVPFFSAWGCTETAPDATHVYWDAEDVRVIGLPTPGTAVKLAPHRSGKWELRVKGPNVTPGYYRDGGPTPFDDEGYFHTGDAGKLLDPADPGAGLLFDGRLGEDFKLTSGVWVHNAALRASIHHLGQPYLLEVIVAAPNREFLTALVYPNLPALRSRFAEDAAAAEDDEAFLQSEAVIDLFRALFRKHNEAETGSSKRFVRFALLNETPQIDRSEATDKGYINQRAVLENHAALVNRLYMDRLTEGIISI